MKTPKLLNVLLIVALVLTTLAPLTALAAPLANSIAPQTDRGQLTPEVSEPIEPGNTRNLPLAAAVTRPTSLAPGQIEVRDTNRLLPKGQAAGTPSGDAALQTSSGSINMPAPDVNFDGVDNVDSVHPPDTNGEVGKDHYIQMVNLSMAIYDKSGTLLYGPFHPNELWPNGDVCRTTNDGDPVVLYDQLADRWVISQFALPNYPYGPFYECIAVTKAGTPTNNPNDWYPYTFRVHSTKMNDYPKLSVWPDGYYMTVNQFASGSGDWAGAGVFAFDRTKMLNGQAASFVYFDLFGVNDIFGGMLSADLDGMNLPPANAPAYFFEVDDDVAAPSLGPDAMRIWKFHVDWTNPLSSTFGLAGQPNTVLPVANFDLLPCVTGSSRNCIPQQGTAQKLDSLGDRLMFRAAYRNFGDHESVMLNHTVKADGTDRAGVRWYEVRNPSTTPTIHQQGTYAPADGKYRWMGSLAMDGAGNVALGYSTSSSSSYPSINYAGRLSTDPLNTLPQAEATIINGTGAQTSTYARWGDYSDMTVDPVDDCTFWYTQQYIATTGYAPWRTRIGSFVFPGCTLGAQGLLSGSVTNAANAAPIAGATIQATASVTNSRSTTTNAGGVYETNLAVGTYSVTASKYGFLSQTVNGVVISDAQTTVQDFALTPAPTYIVSGTVKDATTGWPLYAQITIGGAYPGNPIWTNPATGYYSITLVAGLDYTFNVAAFSPGYQTTSGSITNLSANTTRSFTLDANLQRCLAPGYGFDVDGVFTNFDQVAPPSLPAGWSSVTVQMAPGQPKWATNEGTLSGEPAHSDPNLVYFNSAEVFFGGSSRLTYNNPIDLSAVPTTTLTLWMYHDDGAVSSTDFAQVQVSTDSGFTWTDAGSRLYRYDGSIGWKQHSISLSAYAGQTIDLGILGVSDGGGYLYLDDILLGAAQCVPGQGGLVVGNVSDANTDFSLNGVTVANESGTSTQTVATPLDETNPDGFYLMFAPQGTQPFTATQFYYTPQTANVTVPLNNNVRQNFSLPAGRVAFTPTSINVTQSAGASTSRSVTLTNSGSAAANVEIVELDKGAVPFGPFEKPTYVVKPFRQQFKDALSLKLPAGPIAPPYAAGDVIQSWPTTGVNGPWGVAYDARDNTVWVSSGWDPAKNITEFQIDGTPTGRTQSFTWNPAYGPADAAYNWNTDKLWIMNVGLSDNCIYEIDQASGPTGVKICPTGPQGFAVSQRGLAYDPSTDTYFAGGWGDSMVYRFKPDGTLLNSKNVGIAIAGLAYNPLTGHLFVVDSAYTSKFYVLDVNHNYNLIGTFDTPIGLGGAGLEIDCAGNLWAVDQTGKQVYQLESGESTNVCYSDVPWLSTAPVTATIAANNTQAVDVTLDAAALQPGQYDAQLKFNNDTPYTVANLPVKLTVTPPATWGKLSGSVSTPGYCEAEPTVLAGITVTIQSAGGAWSTVTDADGNYRNWFDQSYSPVTVTVNAAGYQAQQYTNVVVTAGSTTVRDFDVRWLQPCVTTRPAAITVTLGLGDATTRSAFADNDGAAATPYRYTEQILAGQNPGINIPASAGDFTRSTAPASAEIAPQVKVETVAPASPLAALAPVPAYGFNLYDNALVKWADLNTPETWTTIGSTGAGAYFAADFLGADFSTLYAIDRYTNELVTLDTTMLTRTVIGTATPYIGESWSGLTGSTTGVMYASSTSCGSASSLFTINPATGAATRLGAISGAGCVIDLAIDRDGNLYGLDVITNRLYQIDTATGAGTPIGAENAIGFDANYAQGMDFDQVTNVLYLAAFSDTSGGELRIADTSTGGSARVGAFPNNTEVDGLAIATGLGITADIPWLSANPISGTLPADTSITTTLSFNANAVAAPGTYRAGLTLNTHDPYNPTRQSIMTLIVNAPFSWGVLNGDITTLGYCDANPAPLAGAQLTLQGASGAPRTITTDANGHYVLWLDSFKNPYTMTVAAAGQVPNSANNITVNSFGVVTIQDLALRSIQPCVTAAPDSLEVTLPWGGSITQTLTLSNTGAGATPYTIAEKAGGFIPLKPAALPKVLVVNDNGPWGNAANTAAFTEALTTLGYAFEVVDSNFENGVLADMSAYTAVIYAGTPDSTAEQNQLTAYLDDGGRLLIADNELGAYNGTSPLYLDYLEAQFVSINGSQGTLAGQDIMAGITTNASADDSPNSFTLNGPHAVGLFKNVAPYTDWAGSRIQRADYKAVYLAWDYRYTGSAAITDTAKTTVLAPALNWLLAVDDVLPWVSANPIAGGLPANAGVQNINVAFNANAVTQPGTYFGALQVKSNDAQRGTFRVPITMTLVPTDTQGKLNGTITDLGYCDINPSPLAYAALLIQGHHGYSATIQADANGNYQQWLYQSHSPYTVTFAAEGYITQQIAENVITGGITTTLPLNVRRAQPCVDVTPQGLSAQLVLGNQTTLPLTITNSGAAALNFDLRELDYGSTPPSGTPEILIAQDGANQISAEAFATTLQRLGYSYEIVPVNWFIGFPRNLADYRAVIYIGDVYRGATLTQLSNYLDAGGKLLFSSNFYGARATYGGDLRFMNNYLEATFAGEFPYAANVPITGTDIMTGVNTTLSSDPYPEYFTLNGPHATGIFANEFAGTWTGSRVDNGYRLIYLAWNFEYTGSTAPLDPAKAAIVQRSLNWLLGDVPWLSQNITTGTVGANGGAQPIGVTLNAGVPQITQPGDYFAMLKVAGNDPVKPGVNVPVTLTVTAPATWAKFEGTVNNLAACDVNPTPAPHASVIVAANNGLTYTLSTDSVGHYQIWLPASHSPLMLTVSTAGYVTQSRNGISGTGGAIVVNNFDLRLDAPCLTAAPNALLAQQKVNQRITQTLTISNSGAAILDWSIAEQAAPAHPIVIDTLPAFALNRDHGQLGRNSRSPSAPTAPQTFSRIPDFNLTQPVSLTQSTSQDLVFGTSMACFDWMSGNTLANSYYRVYDLPTYGITDSLKVNGIEIGIEEATTSVGQQLLAVKLYTLDGDFVLANLTLIASANYTITDQVLTKVTLPITAIVPAGSKLVVEVYSPNLSSDNNLFYLGANSEPETGSSYIRSVACQIDEPTPTDDLGLPSHYIINVVGLTWPTCDANLPWVSASPLSGSTAASASSPIAVVFNSTGLADGVYTGNLCVFSNDQVQPVAGVPLKMIVGLIHKTYLPLVTKNK
jgi:hypothetical protein